MPLTPEEQDRLNALRFRSRQLESAPAPLGQGLQPGQRPVIVIEKGLEEADAAQQERTANQRTAYEALIPPPLRGAITLPQGPEETLVAPGATALAKYGPPALAGYLTGGASYPAQIGAQLGVTALQQALGIEPRALNLANPETYDTGLAPYAETLLADTLGRGAYGAGRAVLRGVLPHTPPGQRFLTDRAREQLTFNLDRQLEANAFEQQEFQRQIDRALGRGLQRQTAAEQEANRILGAGVQREAGLREGVERFATSTQETVRQAQTLQQRAQDEYGILKQTLTSIGDNLQRHKQLQQVQLRALRQEAAVDARRWLETLPVPSEAEITRLYSTVDTFNNARVPREVLGALDKVRKDLAAKEARIAQIVPEAASPQMRRLAQTQPGRGATAPAVPESLDPQFAPDPFLTQGGNRRIPLKDTPAEALELQDFLRKPDAQGRWGINLSDDELFGEFDALLGRAESGSSRLKNAQSGLTTDQAAQRAHELGFIDSPDVDSLLRALDESVHGRSVYSVYRTPPEVEYPGLAPDLSIPEGPITFQGLRETLVRLGQRIGDARAGVNTGQTGAREQLAALSSIYGALQDALEASVTSGDLTPAARQALQQANAAYKVAATVEDLRGLIAAKIRTPEGGAEVFNPGSVLDALRRPQNKALRDKLDEIGVLSGLERFLQTHQQRLAAPRDAMLRAREMEFTAKGIYRQLSAEEQQAVRGYLARQEAMRQRLQEARGLVDEEVAAVRQQAEARAAMLRDEGAGAVQQAEAEAGMLGTAAQRAQAAGQETVETLRRQRAAIPTPGMSDALAFGYLPGAVFGVGTAVTGNPVTGLQIAAPFEVAAFIARALMTPKGQELVGKILEGSGGLVTPASVVILSQIGKEPLLDVTVGPGRLPTRETLGTGGTALPAPR